MILRTALRNLPKLPILTRAMSTSANKEVYFGPYEVSNEIFHSTPLCYAIVNIKPLLPGHTLVIPYRRVQRLTDLTPAEVTDVFTTVQKIQHMLARVHFTPAPTTSTKTPSTSETDAETNSKTPGALTDGSFNIALQDGVNAGQTVPHVHVHIIPRPRGSEAEGDGFYARLQGEEGNVGGGYWDVDAQRRPVQGGKFPQVRDEDRKPRSREVMSEEAAFYRAQMDLAR